MRITQGRHEGRTGAVHRYANDLMIVRVAMNGGEEQIQVSPAQVRIDPGEHAIFGDYALNGTASVGRFWEMWRIDGDVFVPIVELPARAPQPGRPAGRTAAR